MIKDRINQITLTFPKRIKAKDRTDFFPSFDSYLYKMVLLIHHLGTSVSERVVWLCEELGIEYELKQYKRDAKTNLAPKEYKDLHPYGTSPVIDDGPIRLSESGAVVEYIVYKYATPSQIQQITYSNKEEGFAKYLYFKHFADASLHESIMVNGTVKRLSGENKVENETLKTLANRLWLGYAILENQLAKKENDYIVGNKFTLADLLLFFPLSTMRTFLPFPKTLDQFPNIQAYVKRIGNREAYKRAIQKADPERGFLVKL